MTLLKAEEVNIEYYGSGFALRNVNLSLESGQRVALYGRDSSGKSTILRVLAKLEEYVSGEIYLEGVSLRQYSQKDINFGYSFDASILNQKQSVRDVISYPMQLRNLPQSEIDAYIAQMQSRYALSSDALISQLDDKSIAKLILARLFCVKRRLYLIDDVWKDLPSAEKQEVIAMLKELICNNTAIIAFQDADLLKSLECHSIIVLSNGEASPQLCYGDIAKRPLNMESAILCGYGLYAGLLEKTENCYVANIGGDRFDVKRPISDVYVGKRVCFAVKSEQNCNIADCEKIDMQLQQVQDFYYDINCERIITD